MNYRDKRFCENVNGAEFEKYGQYDIPILKPCIYDHCDFIGFNYAKSEKNKSEKGLHFFVDDYQFERLWRSPYIHTNLIGQFRFVLTPDFSIYNDYPKALQIFNHYRKHWLGALWQSVGYKVIPTISWSDEDSFKWCFDGEPVGGTVAISSVGTQNDKKSKNDFICGYNEMIERLKPETIIFYGKVPEECTGNIIKIKSFQEKFRGEFNGR